MERHVAAVLSIVLALAAVGCSTAQEGQSPPPSVAEPTSPNVAADPPLDPLLSDGLKTLGRHQEGDTIPESEWAPAIRELNPLRVYVDGLDIVVVIEESATQESGKYVVSGLSSKTLQQGDRGFAFSPDPATEGAAQRTAVYDFTRDK